MTPQRSFDIDVVTVYLSLESADAQRLAHRTAEGCSSSLGTTVSSTVRDRTQGCGSERHRDSCASQNTQQASICRCVQLRARPCTTDRMAQDESVLGAIKLERITVSDDLQQLSTPPSPTSNITDVRGLRSGFRGLLFGRIQRDCDESRLHRTKTTSLDFQPGPSTAS